MRACVRACVRSDEKDVELSAVQWGFFWCVGSWRGQGPDWSKTG